MKKWVELTAKREGGDYLIPNLALPEEHAPRLGKYGRKRLSFLQEHKKAYYTGLLVDGKLKKQEDKHNRAL